MKRKYSQAGSVDFEAFELWHPRDLLREVPDVTGLYRVACRCLHGFICWVRLPSRSLQINTISHSFDQNGKPAASFFAS